jgi:hypothetical protein
MVEMAGDFKEFTMGGALEADSNMLAFRAVSKILQPPGSPFGQRSFWLLAAFSLGRRALRPCSRAQALPKAKNPRSGQMQNF